MAQFNDMDFVYIDPETRTVIGLVQWSKTGNVKPLPREEKAAVEGKGEERRRRPRKKEYYPWGSYRSLKRLYHLEGKEKDTERTQTLDEAMGRALTEAYWDSEFGNRLREQGAGSRTEDEVGSGK